MEDNDFKIDNNSTINSTEWLDFTIFIVFLNVIGFLIIFLSDIKTMLFADIFSQPHLVPMLQSLFINFIW